MSKSATKAVAAGIGLAAILGTAVPAAAETSIGGVPAVESLGGLTDSLPGGEALGSLTDGGLLNGGAVGGLGG